MMELIFAVLIIGAVGAFLFFKNQKKDVAQPAPTVAPAATPEPAVIPQPIVVGIPGNRVELSTPTANFLRSGANQGVAGPETWNAPADRTGYELGIGHFRQNVQPAGQYVSYSFKVTSHRTTEFVYALCSGGNSGASVSSYISNSQGVVTSEDTRVLANSQSFYVPCEPDTYVFHVKVSEAMPIQVGVY